MDVNIDKDRGLCPELYIIFGKILNCHPVALLFSSSQVLPASKFICYDFEIKDKNVN